MAPKNKTKTAKGTAVATRKSNAVVTGDAAARMRSMSAKYHEAGGHGFEQRDLVVPFISILQAKSQPCVKTSDKYDEKAEEGMIYNNASGKLMSGEEGIVIIPVDYSRRWTQWKVRDQKGGGGFVKDWGTDESCIERLNCSPDEKGRLIIPGTKPIEQIVESGDFFVFIVDPETGSFERAIISMTSSNWAAAKSLNSLISSWEQPDGEGGTYNPAMFMRPYLLTAIDGHNDQGDWKKWRATPYAPEDHDEESDGAFTTFDLPKGEAICNSAEIFRTSVKKGEVKMGQRSEDTQAEAEGDSGKRF